MDILRLETLLDTLRGDFLGDLRGEDTLRLEAFWGALRDDFFTLDKERIDLIKSSRSSSEKLNKFLTPTSLPIFFNSFKVRSFRSFLV